MDLRTECEIKDRLDDLERKVKDLEGELAGRKRGQRLAADEADHYEAAWEEANGTLKEHLRAAITLIENLAKDGPRPNNVFVEQHLALFKEAVHQKVATAAAFDDFDADLTITILGLVVECEIPFETVARWTREERQQAEAWASQQHAMASDNDVSEEEQLAKPPHVKKLEQDNPKRDDLYDVEVKPPTKPYEHPGVTWARRMKDSPLEWARLHRIELAARNVRSRYRQPDRDQAANEMCRVIDAVELERITEFEGRAPKPREKKKS